MLVLSRKPGERVEVGDDCIVTVVAVDGDKVKLGFTAPKSTKIHREEVGERVRSGILPLTSEPAPV